MGRRRLAAAAAGVLLAAGALGAAGTSGGSRHDFFEILAGWCGATFEGQSSFPLDGPFAGQLLAATIAECDETELRIPFAVGEDRSRTWIITRSSEGLLLKHDHRHEDGTPDEITMYGGWATADGSARSQSFAADGHTKALIPEAESNVWTISVSEDGSELTYYLERHQAPRFKATLVRRAARGAD